MPARERAEVLALYVTGLLLLAFVVSFVFGLLRPATPQHTYAGSEPSRLPGVATVSVPRGRLEVLNGSGRGGLARQATQRLRSGGFDVVYFGNASSRLDSSVVLDRVGRPAIARAAAERLGIQRVRTERDSTRFLDASVVLGRDWPRAAGAAAAPAQRGWWDRVRAWLGAD